MHLESSYYLERSFANLLNSDLEVAKSVRHHVILFLAKCCDASSFEEWEGQTDMKKGK